MDNVFTIYDVFESLCMCLVVLSLFIACKVIRMFTRYLLSLDFDSKERLTNLYELSIKYLYLYNNAVSERKKKKYFYYYNKYHERYLILEKTITSINSRDSE